METIEPEQSNKQASQKHKTGNKQSLEKTGAGLPKQSNWNNHTGKQCRNVLPETIELEQSRWNNHTDNQCRNVLPETIELETSNRKQSHWQTIEPANHAKTFYWKQSNWNNHAGIITPK